MYYVVAVDHTFSIIQRCSDQTMDIYRDQGTQVGQVLCEEVYLIRTPGMEKMS